MSADLRLQVPPRIIEPLSVEQVQRFWSSFRTARDIVMVALLLLNGLRSCEVLALVRRIYGSAKRNCGCGARGRRCGCCRYRRKPSACWNVI